MTDRSLHPYTLYGHNNSILRHFEDIHSILSSHTCTFFHASPGYRREAQWQLSVDWKYI